MDGLRSEVLEAFARMQLLDRQVSVHSADLASPRGDMNRLKESVTVAQRQLSDTQSALITEEGESLENCCHLGSEEQRRESLEALIRSFLSCLADHACLVTSV